MLTPGNTSPCHHSLHLFAKRREPQHAGIAQQLSDRALIYSFLLFSPEVRLQLLGLSLPLYRIIAIGFAWRWIASFSHREIKFSAPDLMISVASIWMIVSFSHNYGFASGFVRGMGVVIDTAGSYFIARACIRTPADLRLLILLLVPAILLAGTELILESLRKDFIVRPFFAKIFGPTSAYTGGAEDGVLELRKEFRIGGLMRAFGPFSHPILGGLVLTSTILLYLSSSLKKIPRYAGALAGCLGFFALSSATILAILLSVSIFFGDKILKKFKLLSWWMVVLAIMMLGFGIDILSKNGLLSVLVRQTLDPQTGYYRMAIWEYGLKSVGNNLLYGIGYAEYQRPLSLLPSASVDAHYLAAGISFGIIVPLALLLAAVIGVLKLGTTIGQGKGDDRNLLFGLNAALVIMLFSSMTVTYFGEARIWFMAIIGIVVSMGQLTLTRVQTWSAGPAPENPRPVSPAI